MHLEEVELAAGADAAVHDDAAAERDAVERVLHAVALEQAGHDDVEAVREVLADRVHGRRVLVGDLVHVARAVGLGQLEVAVLEVRADEHGRRVELEDLREHEARDTLARDEHARVRRDARELRRVDHARQDLDERDLEHGKVRRQHLHVEGLADDELREGSPDIAARDAVADLQADDAAADAVDDAGHLVAQACRRRHELGLPRAAVGLEVAAADADVLDAHADLVVAGLRRERVRHGHLARRVQHGHAHRAGRARGHEVQLRHLHGGRHLVFWRWSLV